MCEGEFNGAEPGDSCSRGLELEEEEMIGGSNLRQRKGKRLWKKIKYELVEYHSLPGFMKDNEYIRGHYRAQWPLKQAVLSIFSLHNETLNVWTHLIGFFLFLSLTIYTAMKVPRVIDLRSLNHLPDVLKRADLHKIQTDLLMCLPSFPHMPDLHKFREELKSMDILPSLNGWHHAVDLLSNCLPERFSGSNHTDVCILVELQKVGISQGLSLASLEMWVSSATTSLSLGTRVWYVAIQPSSDPAMSKIHCRSVRDDVVDIIAPLLRRPITRWPFFAFMGGAMFCLLASSTCHLLACHSERLSYILLRLDYAGIAALISTSFYPPVYYSFMCYPFFCNLYMGFITVLGIITVLVSLLPVFQRSEFRTIRATLFFGMGFSGILPIFHKLFLFRHQPEALHTTGYEILMGIFYGLGALVYATRVPERWMPGKFDIAGHSHQLFHVLVVAGAFTHYRAGLVYLRWRDFQGC